MRLDLEVYAVDLATIEREYGGCGSNVLATKVVVESNGVLAKLDAYGNVEPLGEAVFADSYFAKCYAAKTGNGNLAVLRSGNLEEARNCAGSPEVLTCRTVSLNSHIGINKLHLEESITVEAEGEAVEANRVACSGEALEVINATVGSGDPKSSLTLKIFSGCALIVDYCVYTITDYGQAGIPTVTLAILFLGGSVDVVLIVEIHICIRSIAGTVEVVVLIYYVRSVAIATGVCSLAVSVCPSELLVRKLGRKFCVTKSTYRSGSTGSRSCYVTKLAILFFTTSTYSLSLTGSLTTGVAESGLCNLAASGALLGSLTSSIYPLVITGTKSPILAYGEAECKVVNHDTTILCGSVTAEVECANLVSNDRHRGAYLTNVLAVEIIVKRHSLVGVKLDGDNNIKPTGEVVFANLNSAENDTIISINGYLALSGSGNLEYSFCAIIPTGFGIPITGSSCIKNLKTDRAVRLSGVTVDLECDETNCVVSAREVSKFSGSTAVRNEDLILLSLTGSVKKLIEAVAVLDCDLGVTSAVIGEAVGCVSTAVTLKGCGTVVPVVLIGSERLGAYGTSISYSAAVVCVAESMTCGIAVSLTTNITLSASSTACSAAGVAKRLALGSATALYGTGRGSLTGSCAEGMTVGFALGSVTAVSLTSLGSGTSSVSIVVTKSLALGSVTAVSLTSLGLGTSCGSPVVTKNFFTGGESTAGSGAGRRIVTGSAAKLVAESGLADHVTNRTVLSLSTGCAYPSVLACFLSRATNLTDCALSTVGNFILTSMGIIRPCTCHQVVVTEGDVIEHKALTCSDCRTGEVYRGYTEGESSKRLGNRLTVFAVDVVVNGNYTVFAISIFRVRIKVDTELNVDPTGPAVLVSLYGLKKDAVPAFDLNVAFLISSSYDEEVAFYTPLGAPTDVLTVYSIAKRVINELKSQGKVLVIHAVVELEGKETNRVVSAVKVGVTARAVGNPKLELSAFLLPLSTSILGNLFVSRIGINGRRNVIKSALNDKLVLTVLIDNGVVAVRGDVTSLCVNNGSHTVVVSTVKVINAGKREVEPTRGTPEGDLLGLLAVYFYDLTLLLKDMSSVNISLKFADSTNSGIFASGSGENMVSGNTLREAAIITSLGRLAVSGCPIVTYCLNCFATGVAGSGVVTADLAIAEVVSCSGSNNVGGGVAANLTGAYDSAVNSTGLLNDRDLILVSESSTLGRLTYGTGLGSGAGSVGPNVAKSYALGSATAGTSLGSVTGSIYPNVLKNIALGKSAVVTCLRSCAGCICPVVALSLTGGIATTVTGLRSCAGCVCIVVAKLLAIFKTANFTVLCSLAGSVYPYVSIGSSLAFCCFTYGTGLGGLAVSVYPSMAKSFALGFTALTSLGRLAGCVCPYVLMSHSYYAKNLVFNVVEGVNNRLGKHITGSERKQKDH